jgi:hypothetical protein
MTIYDGVSEDDAVEQTDPTPQDWGFPTNPSTVNKQCWGRQEAFLTAYAQLGTILHAAKAAGISRFTVNKWLSTDLHSFKKRMELAHQDHCDHLERMIDERLANPQGNRGSDILLMFKAKAEMPEKYREEVKVLGMEGPKEMLARLKEMADREWKAQEALEPPAIEPEYREVARKGPKMPAVAPASPEQSVISPVPPAAAKDKRTAKGEVGREGNGKPRRTVTRR